MTASIEEERNKIKTLDEEYKKKDEQLNELTEKTESLQNDLKKQWYVTEEQKEELRRMQEQNADLSN